jgi:nucleoside-diphosphate-sugar epimerase
MKNKFESRVVILGASGFLGSEIEKQAREKDWNVLGLSSRDINLQEADAEKQLLKILRDGDTLIFSAGKVPVRNSKMFSQNLEIFEKVCYATLGVELAQFVLISSDSVYGSQSGLFTELSICSPDTLHGLMSLSKEVIFNGINCKIKCVIRPTPIYGNGDPHNSYGPNRFLKQSMNEGKITIFGNGTSIRDHIFKEDVASIVNETIAIKFSGILNAASGNSCSFLSLAKIVQSLSPNHVLIKQSGNESTPSFVYYDISKIAKVMPNVQIHGIKNGLLKILQK